MEVEKTPKTLIQHHGEDHSLLVKSNDLYMKFIILISQPTQK